MQSSLQHLRNNQIDRIKWDKCIETAINSLIYAYSWYLDITAPGWQAIVLGDYDAVMPLPVKSKWGIKYIYQPFFSQQLGVFSKNRDIDVVNFIDQITRQFKYLSLNLNESNTVQKDILNQNKNYLLNISGDYDSIYKKYSRNCRRNIKKSHQVGFTEDINVSVVEFVNFIELNLEGQISGLPRHTYYLLKDLSTQLVLRNMGEIIGLRDKDGRLHASGLYLFSKDRLIFSVCASSSFGKMNQAMYRLVDFQIRRKAGKYNWYDFSGSNIEGIAYFNSTFGAIPKTYSTIGYNWLPWPLRLIKH